MHETYCFNGRFVGDAESAGSPSVFFLHLLRNRNFGESWHRFVVGQLPFLPPN